MPPFCSIDQDIKIQAYMQGESKFFSVCPSQRIDEIWKIKKIDVLQ